MSMFGDIVEEAEHKQFCKSLQIILEESFNTPHEAFARSYIYPLYKSYWDHSPTLKTFDQLKKEFNNPTP